MSKYEDNSFISKYVGLWAFGYVNGFCGTEAVYRIIENMAIKSFDRNEPLRILDIGCGVGRTTLDLASYFTNAQIISIDSSILSISAAKDILINPINKKLIVNLSDCGFGKVEIPTYNLKNVKLINCDFAELVNEDEFDLIVAVNVLDRCDSVENIMEQIFKKLKPNGVFIGSTPFNFTKEEQWEKMNASDDYMKEIFSNLGFVEKEYFKNVIYRELLDNRMAYNEFCVDVFNVRKEVK